MSEPVLAAEALCTRRGHAKMARPIPTPGEINAVIGPNGAGKSILVARICGEQRPDPGREAAHV